VHGAARTAVRVVARAKVNLALHVTGRRADGYHTLDSLVAFAAVEDGDEVALEFGDGPAAVTVSGPFAADVPAGRDNIVCRAADAVGGIAAVHLRKGFPVASGIGGGSADAAAVLQAVAHERGIERRTLAPVALTLGADVPVCLAGVSCRMEGIGERLTAVALPAVPALLVNPGVPLSTPAVFGRLERRQNPALPPMPGFAGAGDLIAWLKGTRNDLEPAAIALAPAVADALAAVGTAGGCRLARMSGAGATVFGLFTSEGAARAAAAELAAERPGWWVRAATLAG
jgi:4-diphosphocytidyl-2-C-methyl-D-erythritol kinase